MLCFRLIEQVETVIVADRMRAAGRASGYPVFSASFQPSIMFRCHASFEHARAVEAWWKAI